MLRPRASCVRFGAVEGAPAHAVVYRRAGVEGRRNEEEDEGGARQGIKT